MKSLAYSIGPLMVILFGACKDPNSGRKCVLPGLGDGGVSQTVVASPALECPTRICLHVAGQQEDMCTAECESDDDCQAAEQTECTMGFVCAVPVVVGPFCCKRFCICKDFNPSLDTPAACEAAEPANECCNLPGRRENPTMYPGCR